MKNNARRELAGHVFDRTGRIIDGIIDNGRLVLMIGLVVSVAFMVNGLEKLAVNNSDVAEVPTATLETRPLPAAEDGAAIVRIQDRSDYRIKLHYQCAEDEFRDRNLDKCEQLSSDVADAVRDSVKDEIRRDSESHDDDTSLTPAIVATRTQQS